MLTREELQHLLVPLLSMTYDRKQAILAHHDEQAQRIAELEHKLNRTEAFRDANKADSAHWHDRAIATKAQLERIVGPLRGMFTETRRTILAKIRVGFPQTAKSVEAICDLIEQEKISHGDCICVGGKNITTECPDTARSVVVEEKPSPYSPLYNIKTPFPLGKPMAPVCEHGRSEGCLKCYPPTQCTCGSKHQ